jgi:hypothetical protein
MAQPAAHQQRHTVPVSYEALRALKNVKVLLLLFVSHARYS